MRFSDPKAEPEPKPAPPKDAKAEPKLPAEPVVDISTRRLNELLAAEAVLREITTIDGDVFRTWANAWSDPTHLATVVLAHTARTPTAS